MPTFLQRIIESLGAGLDEKALKGLTELDGVSAVSILKKLSEKGDQVRNPSAFVATAAKSAAANGAGEQELRCALEQLQAVGFVDENAVDIMMKGLAPLAECCNSVSHLLQSEESSVRNPSAYITRSVINAKKHTNAGKGAGGNYQMGKGYACGPPARPFFNKLQHVLDPKAREALNSVSPQQGENILQELEKRGHSVRNPSAWVVTSVAQSVKEGGKGLGGMAASMDSWMASSGFGGGWGGGFDGGWGGGFDGGWGGGCDGGWGKGFGGGKGAGAGKGAPQVRRNVPDSPLVSRLDDVAQKALEDIGLEAASAILSTMEGKGQAVNNPSAFVVKAVANARKGIGAGALGDARLQSTFPEEHATGPVEPVNTLPPEAISVLFGDWVNKLDEKAITALESADAQVVAAVIADLETKGDSIRNPSAYALRSVNNAKRGRTDSAPSPDQTQAHAELQEELASLPVTLDEKALAMLEEAPPMVSLNILQVLKKQGGSIDNPSAYIMKAVANEKRNFAGMNRPEKRLRAF